MSKPARRPRAPKSKPEPESEVSIPEVAQSLSCDLEKQKAHQELQVKLIEINIRHLRSQLDTSSASREFTLLLIAREEANLGLAKYALTHTI